MDMDLSTPVFGTCSRMERRNPGRGPALRHAPAGAMPGHRLGGVRASAARSSSATAADCGWAPPQLLLDQRELLARRLGLALAVPHAGIEPAARQQLRMRAALDDRRRGRAP